MTFFYQTEAYKLVFGSRLPGFGPVRRLRGSLSAGLSLIDAPFLCCYRRSLDAGASQAVAPRKSCAVLFGKANVLLCPVGVR